MGQLRRVLLVHPDPKYRESMRRLLVDDGCVVVGEGGTASEAQAARQEREPDVLVVSRCSGDVGALVRDARAAGVRVLLLTMGPDQQFLVDMMLAGANGVVCDCNLPELPDAVRGVLTGGVPVPLALLQGVMEECHQRLDALDPLSPWLRLSERQHEVMELLRRGYDTQRIGEELGLRPATVRAHLAAAMHKLGVSTRGEALTALGAPEPTPTAPAPCDG